MSWRDLEPLDDWYELERPSAIESADPVTDAIGPLGGGVITLTFTDGPSREWFAEWLRSKRGWAAFTAWADEKR
jgi:hypothetical protein